MEIPSYRTLSDANLVILAGEAFSFHHTAMTRRWADYGRYTRTFIAMSALLSAGDYVTAQRARRAACAVLDDVLARWTPSSRLPSRPGRPPMRAWTWGGHPLAEATVLAIGDALQRRTT